MNPETTADPSSDPNADVWNAFVPGQRFRLPGRNHGALQGLTLSVKDLFDVAGHPTGAGNPDWSRTHPVPHAHAPVVQQLLDAGATLVGKTITEELAYSLVGENIHYGTPVNPHNPDCIPGGSSSGAAVAAAAGLCDVSLGTDTAGSVRLPASFCGLWGMRPTHGVLSSEGLVPLSPSFDTPGWMTRQADLLQRVGSVILPPDLDQRSAGGLTLARPADVWQRAPAGFDAAFTPVIERLAALFGKLSDASLSQDRLIEWQDNFRIVQGHEAWACHGDWIRAQQPVLGPGIQERFAWASGIDASTAAAARKRMLEQVKVVHDYLADAVICMPTVAYLAPLKGQASSAEDRTNALSLLCIASMAGLPQLTMPVARLQGKALGLSLVGGRGSDRRLLALALRLSQSLP